MSLEYKFENRGTVQVRPTGSDKRSPCWYMLIGTGLLMLAMLGWLFFSGYLTPVNSSGGIQALTLRGKMNEQERLIEKQASNIHGLEEQLASAKRDQEVQLAANEELRKKFSAAETDLSAQRDKLALYEGILSPEGLEQGLHIQHFSIKERLVDKDGNKVNGDHLYQYHLVLANIRSGDAAVKGSFSIAITGQQDGKDVTVTQKDVAPKDEKALTTFDVKHYQGLEGKLLLPKNFEPESVKVKISPAEGDTPERLAKSYDWASFSKAGSVTKASEVTVSTTTTKE
ncbi:DUF6776 family protein [Thiothrix nivea]|uniref:Uncharacterized protein n=1 Tax=Thiothrix nivea (strain ATCC 35100 / DSM 5205 / JP2) TaxID=870187 RepID=A0A656HKY8_THINJ|nr:DUF6776 family protein [Thiothrix nivea]EIJ35990.1 hypothetical protein Thini_3478 [Thiothrix nivea DSM 5205]